MLYKPTNMEAVKKRAVEIESEGGSNVFLKLQEGTTLLRVLPATRHSKTGNPVREYAEHRINSDKISAITGRPKPDGSEFSIICRRVEIGKRCAICDYMEELGQKSNREAGKLAQLIGLNKRGYANAYTASGRLKSGARIEGSTQVKVWDFAQGICRDLFALFSGHEDVGEDGVDFVHPETGVGVIVSRKGTGFSTKWKISLSTKVLPVKKAVLRQMHNLDQMVDKKLMSFDEQRAALNNSSALFVRGAASGDGDLDDEEEFGLLVDDEEEKPKKAKRSKGIKIKVR